MYRHLDALRATALGLAVVAGLAVRPAEATASPVTDGVDAVVGLTVADATGTGFVTAGGVLTAAHVVGAHLEVVVAIGDAEVAGRVVRVDPVLDVALIEAPLPPGVPALELDLDPEVGEAVTVVAVDPVDGPVLTRGIVSALPRASRIRFLQTDAAVNPGTSGGPVLGDDGRVLGLVVTKDRLRDDVGRAHLAADLAAFLAGESGSAPPSEVDPVPVSAPGPAVPPVAPLLVLGGLGILGLAGGVRGRRTRPANDDISIRLGPVTEIPDQQEGPRT